MEPYRIKMVEPIPVTTRAQRARFIEEAGYNTFLLPSTAVTIDLLTDSGTSAMSDRQWAGMMLGDEAYAGSVNFRHLEEAVRDVYGYRHVVPAHQGRGAEHLLARALIRPGHVIPGNMYFTTTRAHQELAGGEFRDVIVDEAHDPQSTHPFKGNVDLNKLARLIAEAGAARIPYISVAATVNMAGGQPISLANLKEVRELCRKHRIPVYLDAARAVENAYFIQQRERGQGGRSVAAILREICDLTDGCTMSGKKDCLVNIGGFLATNDEKVYDEVKNLGVIFEGLHTYGGLAGRDMEAMAIGIRESVDDAHVRARVEQVEYLGRELERREIPVLVPFGGHAVYLDARRFLPHIPQDRFPAQALCAWLYLESGVRGMERGIVSAGRESPGGDHRRPQLELVRLAVPRRVYTHRHLDFVVEAAARTHRIRDQVPGLEMIYEPKHLRFFQARFRPIRT